MDNSSVDKRTIKHSKQIYVQIVGSRNAACTSIYDFEKKEILVNTGCFGESEDKTLDDLRKAVKKKHGNNNYGKEYLAYIESAKKHFEIWKDELDKVAKKEGRK